MVRWWRLAVGDIVVAAHCWCCSARAHLPGILIARPGETWLPTNGADRRHGFFDTAFARGVCCQLLVIFPSVEGWQLHLGCRLCMRTIDSPARQRHAGWEVIDHQRSTRPLNWGSWLAFLFLCLVLRNFSACFRWHRRTTGGTAFALAPEPFQGILRPSLPYLLWSNSMIISCGNRLRIKTLHCCHLMLIR
jgi:hypothetical protein